MQKKRTKTKKRRLNKKKLFVFVFFIVLGYFIYHLVFSLKIKNIYILNNNYLTDQQIIDIAKISNYPSTFANSSSVIKKRLNSNDYILSTKVYKKWFNQVYINVTENKPLFYYQALKRTILYNEFESDKIYNVPTLLNIVPDEQYTRFVKEMRNVDNNIINRISEIKYDPNNVDSGRFLLYMNDGNYVYLTLDKFDSINSYLDIIKNVGEKKGILYLDYGNNFTVMD